MPSNSNILIDVDDDSLTLAPEIEEASNIVAWIMHNVEDWEQHRKDNYEEKWDEYYRLWRGIWTPKDKNRGSERSRIIAPATQQAVEATTAELEESTFSRKNWFSLEDDIQDGQKEDVGLIAMQLKEDMSRAGNEQAIAETFLAGSLYGTGISKIIVDTKTQRQAHADPLVGTQEAEVTVFESDEVLVKTVMVDPKEFAIDPTAKSIDEALGCAHTPMVPRHLVQEKQQAGVYRDVRIGVYNDSSDTTGRGEVRGKNEGKVRLVEYHGLVPTKLLVAEDIEGIEDKEAKYTECIVTIANDGILLRAIVNPFMMKDRSFVAYPHDKVPGKFWGRGVAEKGYNPQKALDAELRARIDALALSTHPMMGIDATRIPRGGKFEVRPGRNVLTNGNPNESLMPLKFAPPDPHTFQQTGELERMIQMGTGAMDSATPVGISPRNQTASGMSMIMSGMIKRTKRTMQNIERYYLRPLITKIAWRYMQFAPDRYPVQDYKFIINASMGHMAKEFEASQLTQLLQTVPPQSPAYWVIVKGIFQNSANDNRDELLQLVDGFLEQAMNPPEQGPDPQLEIEAAKIELKHRELDIKQDEIQVTAELEATKVDVQEFTAKVHKQEVDARDDKNAIDAKKLKVEAAIKEMEARFRKEAAIEVATIKADNDLKIAKLNSDTTKETTTSQQVARDNAPTPEPQQPIVINTARPEDDVETTKLLQEVDNLSKSLAELELERQARSEQIFAFIEANTVNEETKTLIKNLRGT